MLVREVWWVSSMPDGAGAPPMLWIPCSQDGTVTDKAKVVGFTDLGSLELYPGRWCQA